MSAQRVVLVIPGSGGCWHVPQQMFAVEAARRRGAEPHHLSWRGEVPAEPAARGPWAVEQIAAALGELRTPLVIANSLGTLAAGLAADRELPAVWITPLLHRPEVVDGLRRAAAPGLLIGGTADPSWRPDLARELSPYVCEVADADHGLRVPGPLARSAAVLGEVATAVEEFLDQVVWPAPSARRPAESVIT
ncbi:MULTISPECIES: alpha/beta hydrolase [Micromonospora]|uniref:alpha/beta hydrolase n=1 Tax=Micromonospora TaxID=1873 RepID=UPI00131A30FB|nr:MULTISPECIES: alpha/beta hydrolase [Micromonospora]NES16088.1 alpha/beta hydrolase [Micromonospora sp. PPF5-17B]NES39739.1 alpha/beta hydrolase [Micromonospora solifontis]NES57440.1 alpha/beta hydrolase [Micromonospora sp. PPF5-6]